MNEILHFLKKDLRQYKLQISAFGGLLLAGHLGEIIGMFFSITHGTYYMGTDFLFLIAGFGYVALCASIGYWDSPLQKEHFLATRPWRLVSPVGAKMILVLLLMLFAYLLELISFGILQVNSNWFFTDIWFFVLLGWIVLILYLLWPSPKSPLLGMVCVCVILFAIFLGFAVLCLNVYPCPDFNLNAVLMTEVVVGCLLLGLTRKLERVTYPICTVLFCLGSVLAVLVGMIFA